MEKLLSLLKSIPEYGMLLDCVSRKESAAVTGIGQMNRSHMIAALHTDTKTPLVVICQDDMADHRGIVKGQIPGGEYGRGEA